MIASFVLLIAARFVMPSARRSKIVPGRLGVVPGTMTAPVMPSASTPVNPWSPQMQLPASDLSGIKTAGISDNDTSLETLPPTTFYGIDSRQLLQKVADLAKERQKIDTLYEKYDNAQVCQIVRDVVAIATNNFVQDSESLGGNGSLRRLFDDELPSRLIASRRTGVVNNPKRNRWLQRHHDDTRSLSQLATYATGLEMVGMIPKTTSLQSGSSAEALESISALGASVQALGVFSREAFEDDSRGSLRKQIKMHYKNGRQWTPSWLGKRKLEVFAIEGLVDVPGFSESSARVLMSKIAQYANEEQRVVVVPIHAYNAGLRAELGAHYERLGFKVVNLEPYMGGFKSQVLLYVGDAMSVDKVPWPVIRPRKMAEDASAEEKLMMIGMNLWTAL